MCLRFSYYIHTHSLTELPPILLFLSATKKQQNIKYASVFSDLHGEKMYSLVYLLSSMLSSCSLTSVSTHSLWSSEWNEQGHEH